MMLVEQAAVPGAALPVAELKAHLRLGSGFADDTFQDALLEGYLRAAIAAVEGRTAKMLVTRRFLWTLEDWRDRDAQALPCAPVADVISVSLVDGAGMVTTVDPARYRLVQDTHRPKLAAKGLLLPMVPDGGRAEVVFDAGFGAWAAVPKDLGQAVFLLAAEYYEARHEAGLREGGGFPAAVNALISRWRTVRVLGGGQS
jgi:uncharacterized phiE125 gp8 family phage protein